MHSYQPTNILWRRTKIIATLGPTSHSEETISKLIDTGANIFRLNMSHGNHDEHRLMTERIRKVAKNKQTHIAILMDLCGPKIRVGLFANDSIELYAGEKVIVSCSVTTGKQGLIPSQYKNLYKDVKAGERILLDDGKIELNVLSIQDKEVKCEVVYGGVLKSNKGLNLPDSAISATSFSTKDKKDASLAIELEADFLALSFVRDEKCINTLKQYLAKAGADIPVIAKIEKPEAVKTIDNILEQADGIMIARGDLGIEMPAQQVPLIQKELINKARFHGKPVIVATQMLESMITNSKPTRAEVSDVATAALSSADAVMLSAETASGDFPLLAVKVMAEILQEIDHYQCQHGQFGCADFNEFANLIEPDRKAISSAVKTLALELNLQGILVPTYSGATAKVLSADRPCAPLIGASCNEKVCRRLALNWGVIPILIEEKITHDWQELCNKVSAENGLAKIGNRLLLVSGFNHDPLLNEPVIKLLRVKAMRDSD